MYGTIYGLYDSTGLRYIGQTTQAPERRLKHHLSNLKNDYRSHWLRKLKAAGERPTLRVIVTADDAAELNTLERAYIDQARESGHALVNTMVGGDVTWAGKKFSEEHKAKIAEALTGRKRPAFSAEWRAKLRAASLGRVMPADSVRRGSEKRRGKSLSAEHREKLRLANLGKQASPETRAKMSASRKGRPRSSEAVVKTVATRWGKT